MVSRARPWGIAALFALILNAACAFAQTGIAETADAPAVLIADNIQVRRNRVLIANGNVEAFQGRTRLTAQEIRYDRATGKLVILGPITIQDGSGVTVLASQAELSDGLQNGLLTGARMVLSDQLQLAAVQINRVGGRYTQLYKTAVTSCRICEGDPTPPLWQIRAKRVIHDREEQQLYFDEAQLRVRGVPILYLPKLRLPDPTLKRTSGFLIPSIKTSSELGIGLKIPYFIRIGDHRDLTLTPYLSGKTRTLEFRYRQAFARGRIAFAGAITEDDLEPGRGRGYLFGAGEFDLRRDFVLQFDVELTSDDAYLKDYSYSQKDRLDSELRISRTRRDEYIRFSYINFKSLRDDEDNDILPNDVIAALYERRFFPSVIGGEFRLTATAHSHFRQSGVNTDINLDGIADGRDVMRLNIEADWIKSFQLGGLQVETRLGLAADAFNIEQDSTFNTTDSGFAPRAGIVLRYPMVRYASGMTHLIEPVLQIGWTGSDPLAVPNEESTRVEFDEGNLLSLSRFPAQDRRERGWALAYGARWSGHASDSWSANVTLGQVLRDTAQAGFTETSGLATGQSDFLFAGQLKFEGGLALSGRTLFDQRFSVAKAEMRGDWSNEHVDLGGSYVWLTDDAVEDRLEPIRELTFDGGYQIDRFWRANLDWRYDLEERRAATAGAGLIYANECVTISMTINRRYTSSTSVEPSTNLGFTVSLRGFSANVGRHASARSCGKQAK